MAYLFQYFGPTVQEFKSWDFSTAKYSKYPNSKVIILIFHINSSILI